MAAIAGATREPAKIDTSLAGKTAPPRQQPAQPTNRPGAPQPQDPNAPTVPLAQ
jgi:hypothetical protein